MASTRQHDDRQSSVAAALNGTGWAVYPDYLPLLRLDLLATEARRRWQQGGFHKAGIGRGATFQFRPDIRGDHVLWLDQDGESELQRMLQDELESLRHAINHTTLLGLHDFEGHFTVYPPGAFYQRHVDQFQGVRHRVVSLILYLNDDWRPKDGGMLRLYHYDTGGTETFTDVLPRAGTLVCFLSDSIAHEVLPTRRERYSFTGWFRVRV